MTDSLLPEISYPYTLRMTGRTYCPGCGVQLTQRTFHIHADLLWCLKCGEGRVDAGDWLAFAVRWWTHRHGFQRTHGVRCWTPSNPRDGIIVHYLESRTRPYHVMSDSEAQDVLDLYDRTRDT